MTAYSERAVVDAANASTEANGSSDVDSAHPCHVAVAFQFSATSYSALPFQYLPPFFIFYSDFSGVLDGEARAMRPSRVIGWVADADKEVEWVALVTGYRIKWWNEMDESNKWQRELFYVLCGCYSLLSFVALVQLIRVHLRVPEYRWTTQKLFHSMNFIVHGWRAVLFGFYGNVFHLRAQVLKMALLDLPGLLFVSTYTLLVLFWAEIYHQARSQPVDNLRPAYTIINGIIYAIQLCIWVYVQASESPIAMEIAKLFFAFVSFSATLGFLIYGGRLFFLLKRFHIESRGRSNKLTEVGFVTGICCTCFLIRSVMVTVSAFNKETDLDALDNPILNCIYYLLVEILPSSLVLFILRKLPAKRASDRYHPIH